MFASIQVLSFVLKLNIIFFCNFKNTTLLARHHMQGVTDKSEQTKSNVYEAPHRVRS